MLSGIYESFLLINVSHTVVYPLIKSPNACQGRISIYKKKIKSGKFEQITTDVKLVNQSNLGSTSVSLQIYNNKYYFVFVYFYFLLGKKNAIYAYLIY